MFEIILFLVAMVLGYISIRLLLYGEHNDGYGIAGLVGIIITILLFIYSVQMIITNIVTVSK